MSTPSVDRFAQLRRRFSNEKKVAGNEGKETPIVFLMLAIWFGLVIGVVEGVGQTIRIVYLGRTEALFGPEVIWMAPLANIGLYGVLGLIFYVVAKRWPGIVTLRTVSFILFTFGISSLLFLSSRLHKTASVVLAAGVTMQLSYFIVKYRGAFYALVRITGTWTNVFRRLIGRKADRSEHPMTGEERFSKDRRQFLISTGAVMAGLTAGVQTWQGAAEKRALATLSAPPESTPNVLLIVLDTVRAKSLSLHGYERATSPQLDRFARTGVRFENAYSTAPWTLPSHASIFTGHAPHKLFNAWYKPLDGRQPTLAEQLEKRGYLTAGFVSNLFFCSTAHGLSRGFTHYEDHRISPGQAILSSTMTRTLINSEVVRQALDYHELLGRKTAPMVNSALLRWLSRQDESRPFFAFLNYNDAHEPYLPPEEFALRFAPTRPRGHFSQLDELDTAVIRELNSAYDGAISYLDHHVGALLDEMQQREFLDNTLVVIMSDHGEQFGEHGLMGHANSLYMPNLHVPLLISFPSRVPAGEVISQPVSLSDIPSTVSDLLGLEDDSPFPGESLARHWSTSADPKVIFSEVQQNELAGPSSLARRANIYSLIFDGMHYIKYDDDGREELFDCENDPLEESNLAESIESDPVLEQFRRSLKASLGKKV